MKRFLFILTVFLLLSCKTAPKVDELPVLPEIDAVAQQTVPPEPEKITVSPAPVDDDADIINVQSPQDGIADNAVNIPVEDTGEEFAVQAPAVQAPIIEETLVAQEPATQVSVIEDTPAAEDADMPAQVTEAVEEAPLITQPPVIEEETQAVIAEDSEPEAEASPFVSQEPPLPPLALLGPAEERSPPVTAQEPPPMRQPERQPAQPAERQPAASQPPPVQERPPVQEPPPVQERQPPRQTSIIPEEAPVTPAQTVIVPPQPQAGTDIAQQAAAFSRIVRATVGQTIEIPFRGNGWVYLGELASRRGVDYRSSRRDTEGQSFIFMADAAGTYVLRFFREDFLRGYILYDHVQVIVGEPSASGPTGWFNPPVDRGRVVAQPRWPSSLDEAAIQRGSLSGSREQEAVSSEQGTVSSEQGAVGSEQGTVSSGQGTGNREQGAGSREQGAVGSEQGAVSREQGTVSSEQGAGSNEQRAMSNEQRAKSNGQLAMSSVQGTESGEQLAMSSVQGAEGGVQPRERPETLLQRAKETFDGGNAASAIALLDQYREYYPDSDELYWLYGQFYEANSPSRDILLSLDYYRRLVREYPQSSRLSDARRRIAYLERFYINIQ